MKKIWPLRTDSLSQCCRQPWFHRGLQPPTRAARTCSRTGSYSGRQNFRFFRIYKLQNIEHLQTGILQFWTLRAHTLIFVKNRIFPKVHNLLTSSYSTFSTSFCSRFLPLSTEVVFCRLCLPTSPSISAASVVGFALITATIRHRNNSRSAQRILNADNFLGKIDAKYGKKKNVNAKENLEKRWTWE